MGATFRFLFLLAFMPSGVLGQTVDIHHINIGQGDSTLILGPPDGGGDRTIVLIDAGDRGASGNLDGGLVVGQYLARLGITEIDFFVATHYDADHIGGVITGAIGVHGHSFVLGPDNAPGNPGDDDGDGTSDWLDGTAMQQADPEELGTGDDIVVHNWVDRGDVSSPGTQTYNKYFEMASRMGARHSLLGQTEVDNFQINLGGGATMTAVSANGFVRNRTGRVANVNTENERSVGFWLQFGGFDYLICGDLIGRRSGGENAQVERAVGQFLTAQSVEIDVLHVNHHGADNTSDTTFLSLIDPEVAIISAGNGNSHNHPRRQNLRRLADAGVERIYQTNHGTTRGWRREDVRLTRAIAQNDIVLSTDGITYIVTVSESFSVDN